MKLLLLLAFSKTIKMNIMKQTFLLLIKKNSPRLCLVGFARGSLLLPRIVSQV